MEIVAIIYLICGIMVFVSIGILVLFVAGKDILIAFQRKFTRKGCDVYVANQTRIISHYFMTPKEGIFRVNKLPYITNPEKTMNLTEMEQKRVSEFILKRQERITKRIKETETKIKELRELHKKSKDEKQKYFIASQIESFISTKKSFEDILRLKQENYFKDKKPAFFYIENDPIPKDFHEYYSTLDAKMVDNLVSRAISQPPSEKQQQDFKKMLLYVAAAVIAGGIAAILAFQNNGVLNTLCQHLGASC